MGYFVAAVLGMLGMALINRLTADPVDWQTQAAKEGQLRRGAERREREWKQIAETWHTEALSLQGMLREQAHVTTAPSLAAVHPYAQTPRGVLGWSEHPPLLGDRLAPWEKN